MGDGEYDDGSGYDNPPEWSARATLLLVVGVVVVVGAMIWLLSGSPG